MDAFIVEKTRSTNKEIFTVEKRDSESEEYYCVVGHKPGVAYLKTSYVTGESDVVRIKVHNPIEPSKKEMKKAILNTFKDAKKNDVSFFYYSSHGSEGGSLCSHEKDCSIKLISPKELASWLNNIPGKVIVVLDSCFSGGMINRSDYNSSVEFASYNTLNAFKEQDDYAKSDGALCDSKFKVLTACNKKEYSYCTDEYGYFTKALIQGTGYAFETGEKFKKASADINKDNILTLEECYQYTAQFAAPESRRPSVILQIQDLPFLNVNRY